MPVKIALVDDHKLFRKALASLIEGDPITKYALRLIVVKSFLKT